MLDVQGYKSSQDDTREFDSLAKEIFQQDTSTGSSLDTLVGHDQNGNLWVYASQEAKLSAEQQSITPSSREEQRTTPEMTHEFKNVVSLRGVHVDEEGTISRAE